MNKGLGTKHVVPVLVLALCGCAPLYQLPDQRSPRAELKFSYESKMMRPNVATFAYSENSLNCQLGLQEGTKRLAVISRGNPMVSDVNVNGLFVAAEQKFRIKADAIPLRPEDGCFKIVTFTPRGGAAYEVKFVQTRANMCSISITELTLRDGVTVGKESVTDFGEEACVRQ